MWGGEVERPAEVICLGSYSANAPLVEAHGRLIREKEEMWEQRERRVMWL